MAVLSSGGGVVTITILFIFYCLRHERAYLLDITYLWMEVSAASLLVSHSFYILCIKMKEGKARISLHFTVAFFFFTDYALYLFK